MTKEIDISTVLIDGEYATIMGVKYKRVEPPKSTILWNMVRDELGYSIDCCDEIVDLVEKWLPEPQNASGSQNVDIELLVDGFNHCLTKIKGKLR